MNYSPGEIIGIALAWILGLALLIGLIVGGAFGCKAYTRYQARADANNNVSISNIEIRNQEQRVKIARQQAQIRFQNAIGIKRAQDEIQKTLTPLYVQFEMVDALKSIASSGSNNSVVYIPVGANGIPLISGAGPQVKLPNGTK